MCRVCMYALHISDMYIYIYIYIYITGRIFVCVRISKYAETCISSKPYMHRQTDRQTDRRQTDRQTERLTG